MDQGNHREDVEGEVHAYDVEIVKLTEYPTQVENGEQRGVADLI
jgi:hypothetical protein